MIEALDARRLFAATAALADGVLTVTGTGGADVIEFEAAPKAVIVHANGVATRFDTATIRRVRVYAGAGNDTVLLGKKFAVRASIEGGAGNDRLGGGAGEDILFGQGGDDTLNAGGGRDYIDAGAGNDSITDTGASVVHGGSGEDTLDSPYASLRSGVEHANIGEDYSGRDVYEVRREGGRLILHYTIVLGGTNGDIKIEGPTRQANGTNRVVFRVKDLGGGALITWVPKTVDITGTDATGLTLEAYYDDDVTPSVTTLYLPNKK